MKCTGKQYRQGDEFQCECGICWSVDEDKPDCQELSPRLTESEYKQRRNRNLRQLHTLKQEYFE